MSYELCICVDPIIILFTLLSIALYLATVYKRYRRNECEKETKAKEEIDDKARIQHNISQLLNPTTLTSIMQETFKQLTRNKSDE